MNQYKINLEQDNSSKAERSLPINEHLTKDLDIKQLSEMLNLYVQQINNKLETKIQTIEQLEQCKKQLIKENEELRNAKQHAEKTLSKAINLLKSLCNE